MSKQLYPKPKARGPRHSARERVEDREFHVYYYDPDNDTATPEWKHYDSELAVRADAFYQCRVLGFRPAATLFNREEFLEGTRAAGELE